jgi:hypothetical protein
MKINRLPPFLPLAPLRFTILLLCNFVVNLKKRAGGIAAALFLLFPLFSCENPMVNYLLGEREKKEEWIDTSPVARWWDSTNSVWLWYDSLKEAVDAADDGISAASPSLIEIRRNVTRSASMGDSGISLPAGKHIRLDPYTPDTASAAIRRWETGGAFFTIEYGASLALGAGITVDGALIPSSGPLVMVEAGAEFTMEDGSLVTRGKSSNPGGGVYVEWISSVLFGVFTMKGGVRADDVYLETGAMITLDGTLGANPVTRITPAAYTAGEQVLDGVSLPLDISDNNEKFDVTPETVPGWDDPRHWRVDNDGKLYVAVARRFDGSQNVYYPSLQDAFDQATGSASSFDTVTLIANIELDSSGKTVVSPAHYINLTVPAGTTYVIKRVQDTTETMLFVDILGGLEMSAPAGSELILDGGAAWTGGSNGTPAGGAVNGGVISSRPLISVDGVTGGPYGRLILRSGVVLKNNDTTSHGAAIEAAGYFSMYGGLITSNRTAGSGGGIFFRANNGPAVFAGGSITNNDAGLTGGGIMLDYSGENSKLTMTGGLIRGNRAQSRGGLPISGTLGGFGGGVFIPGKAGNKFIMTGGTIQDNVGGTGNNGHGIVMDRSAINFSDRPTFTIEGNASIINNDVHLHVTTFNDCFITIDGLFSPSTHPIRITLDNYTTLPKRALGGSNYSPYISKFTAAPYNIDSLGRIY